MKTEKLKKLIMAALFAAFTCVSTIIIQIPSPMNGYVNMGDCMVILSGWILGPLYGTVAAALGSMMADVVTGYAYYAAGTLVIKGCVALISWVMMRKIMPKTLPKILSLVVSAAAGEAFMIAGYWAYSGVILGSGMGAAASIPGNAIQGLFGVCSSVAVCSALMRNRTIRGYIEKTI